MAEFPKFPLWTDAYLADTTHLTTIEHGAYFLLLVAMWRTSAKSLPNDDKLLARYAKLTPGQWKRIRPIIIEFFDVSSDRITQGRLTDEANAVRQHSMKQSDKAKARWLKNNNTSDAVAMPVACPEDASLSLSLSLTSTNVEVMGDNAKTSTKKEASNGKQKRGTRLPADWQPSAEDYAYAIDRGLSHADTTDQAENFVEHFTNGNGRNKTRVDWSLSWQSWVRRTRPTNGSPRGGQPVDAFTAGLRAVVNRGGVGG